MNLTLAVLFVIVCTLVIEFFTYKKDDAELDDRSIILVARDFVIDIFIYFALTLIFSLIFKNYLVNNDYFVCNNNCHIKVANTFYGILFLVFQILNLYNFFDSYAHTYRVYAQYQNTFWKILTVVLCIIAVLFNEFLLSNINLGILTFKFFIFDILIKLVEYSVFFFLPLVIVIKEVIVYRRTRRIDKEFEESFEEE